MTPEQMKLRTKRYALAVIGLMSEIPRHYVTDCIARQIVRSSTSVGANYRAACRARSAADFIAKLKIVEEEADETIYWLELLLESGSARTEQIQPLLREGNEILAIVVASIKTKRQNL